MKLLLFALLAFLQPVPPLTDDDARVPPDARRAPKPLASMASDIRIDALLWGYQWRPVTPVITYSFYSNAVFAGTYYGGGSVSEVSEPVKRNVRSILLAASRVFRLTFIEVAESQTQVGLIRVMRNTDSAYAYAYAPSSMTMLHVAGDVHLNPAYDHASDTNGFQNGPGTHGYSALIHELGHTLGLKHPHTGTPLMPIELDLDTNTVMSYKFSWPAPGAFQSFDRLALAYLYGAVTGKPAAPTNVRTYG